MSSSRDITEKIEDLITAVYRERSFDPWTRSAQRSLYFENIFRSRLKNWPVRNQTDLVYGSSTTLAFLLHPGHYMGVTTRDGIENLIRRLGGECYMALIEISHMGPYARIRFTREKLDENTGTIDYYENESPFRDSDFRFIEDLTDVLDEEGIEILPLEILNRSVPDIQLDVTNRGCATIYHCLFNEE